MAKFIDNGRVILKGLPNSEVAVKAIKELPQKLEALVANVAKVTPIVDLSTLGKDNKFAALVEKTLHKPEETVKKPDVPKPEPVVEKKEYTPPKVVSTPVPVEKPVVAEVKKPEPLPGTVVKPVLVETKPAPAPVNVAPAKPEEVKPAQEDAKRGRKKKFK